jgi:hypothetical protein
MPLKSINIISLYCIIILLSFELLARRATTRAKKETMSNNHQGYDEGGAGNMFNAI